MSQEEEKIEKLKKGLYSRNVKEHSDMHPTLHDHDLNVSEDWKESPTTPQETKPPLETYHVHSSSFFKKVLWGSIAFFTVCLGFALYILYGGGNIVSADNVDILVAGPVSVSGGEEIALDIEVQNNNTTGLKLADLAIEFPQGTASPVDVTEELKRHRELLGDINARQSVTKKIKIVMFGEENSKKEVKITVEYRVEGSNAIFYKEKTFDILISSAPVSMTVESFKEVNANQEVELTLTINSNSPKLIRNVLLKGEYPFGFTFTGSDPSPLAQNNVWKIGDLTPGSKKVVKVRGKIGGQDEEERVFRFNLGLASPKDDKNIGTALISSLQPILVKKPFLGVTLAIDGDTSSKDYAALQGKSMRADISWVNNLPVNVIDQQIIVKLGGVALDKTSISTDGGFYRSVDNTIVWDKTNTPSLALSHPGEGARVSFSFTPRVQNVGNVINPDMTIDVSVKGKRVGENQVPEEITSGAGRKVRVASTLEVTPRIVRTTGPFANTGPFPPAAEKESTYTVIWTITNTSSSISGAVVSATLPSYVKWQASVSPATEKVSYNPVGGEVVWNVGDVAPNTGYKTTAREVAFQVSFTPSVSQIGESPVLLSESLLEGTDRFAGVVLKNVKGAQNTRLSSDPAFKTGEDKVVE